MTTATATTSLLDLPIDSVQTKSKDPIKVIDYTDKTCVVIGDTYKYRELLKQQKGRWTPRLLQLPGVADKGWMFPIAKKAEIERLISNWSATESLISPMPETRIPTPKINLKSLSPIGTPSGTTISESSASGLRGTPHGASSLSSTPHTNEISELISYNKRANTIDDRTNEITITQIEDFIRDGKKVRVTTTTITRTENIG